MVDYRTLENKIRDIVARPWTKDPKQVHHKQQQIQKKIIDEEPDMLNNKALGIPDSVVEAAKQINKGKTEVDVNPQYKPDMKDPEDDNDDKKSKKNGMTKEELKGKQHKIDKNKNGKIDAHDFKLLRKEEVEQIDEKEIVFTGSPKHTAKKAEYHKKMGYKVVSLKKHTSGIFGDNSEKHTYKMAKEEVEQVDEISKDTLDFYKDGNDEHQGALRNDMKYMKARMKSKKGPDSYSNAANYADQKKKLEKRKAGMRMADKKIAGKAKVNATEEAEQVAEISDKTLQSYRTKAMAHSASHQPGDTEQQKADRNRKTRNRSQGVRTSWNKMIGRYVKVGGGGKKTYEEVILSDEEQTKLDEIAATFAEDAIQSAQKSAQQKVKAASINAKATLQADKIKDQARKQAQNNSYEPEGEMLESNLAAQIRDAKPSVTGHIEVSVGDKKVKIPHRKAQDFLGSYHAKRTADEKDAHEKAFRKEIGG